MIGRPRSRSVLRVWRSIEHLTVIWKVKTRRLIKHRIRGEEGVNQEIEIIEEVTEETEETEVTEVTEEGLITSAREVTCKEKGLTTTNSTQKQPYKTR